MARGVLARRASVAAHAHFGELGARAVASRSGSGPSRAAGTRSPRGRPDPRRTGAQRPPHVPPRARARGVPEDPSRARAACLERAYKSSRYRWSRSSVKTTSVSRRSASALLLHASGRTAAEVDAVDVGLHGRDLRAAALALLGLVRQRVAPAEVQRREIARERGAEAIRQFDDGGRGPGVHGRADEILARLVARAARLPLIQPDNMSLLVSHVRRQVPKTGVARARAAMSRAFRNWASKLAPVTGGGRPRTERDHGRVADGARPVR